MNDPLHTAAAAPQLSVVIPIYNEAENLPDLVTRVHDALAASGRSFELICVDDGSRDGSAAILEGLAAERPWLKPVYLIRNYGQSTALQAGFDVADGEFVATLDGDLQNDPADVPRLLDHLDANPDIDAISGWRKDRQDAALSRKLPSRIANGLISRVTGVKLHDYGCALKVYRGRVIRDLRLYGELHRFIPALASQVGGTVTEVPVSHRARQYGRSKYGISRTVRVMLDLITVWFLGGYGTRPIHVFGTLGLIMAGVGVLLGLYLTLVKLVEHVNIGGRPMLLLAVLLVVIGAQLVTMGLLAEINIRTYYESQGKPIYVVREVVASQP